MINMPSIIQRQPTIPQGTSVQIQSYPPSTNILPTSRSTPNVRQSKSVGNPYALLLPPRSSPHSPSQIQQSIPSLLNNAKKKLKYR